MDATLALCQCRIRHNAAVAHRKNWTRLDDKTIFEKAASVQQGECEK